MSVIIVWSIYFLAITGIGLVTEKLYKSLIILRREVKEAKYRMHIEDNKYIQWSYTTERKYKYRWIPYLLNKNKTGI